MRSFSTLTGANGTISKVSIYLAYLPTTVNATSPTITHADGTPYTGTQLISIVNDTNLADFVNLNGTGTIGNTGNPTPQVANVTTVSTKIFGLNPNNPIGLVFEFTTPGAISVPSSGEPIVADFFSVGLIGDGTQNNQRINNGIYRYQLEETAANTGVYTGTNQYVMLNQLNIFDPNTYSTLRTVDHDVFFPAIQDMLQAQANAPQITYLDLGQDGVNTQISTQTDIPTHTGVVSFDSKTYKIGDTVTITVNDQDLNTNNDLVVIYTAVTPKLTQLAQLYKMLTNNSNMVTYKTQQSIQSAKQV